MTRQTNSARHTERVLRDVDAASPATTFLGMKHRMPVLLAPIASLTDVDPEGALPVARAAAGIANSRSESPRKETA